MSSLVSALLNAVVATFRRVTAVWDWVTKLQVPNIFKAYAYSVGLIALGMLTAKIFSVDLGELPEWFAILPLMPIIIAQARFLFSVLLVLICVVVGLPCLLVIYLSILVLSILMMPFGLQFAASGTSLKITAEATPPGEWSLVQLGTTHQTDEGVGMQHSTHSNPEALKILKNWFQEVS